MPGTSEGTARAACWPSITALWQIWHCDWPVSFRMLVKLVSTVWRYWSWLLPTAAAALCVGAGRTASLDGAAEGSMVGFTSESSNCPPDTRVMTGRGSASCPEGAKSIDGKSDVGNAEDTV